MRSETVFVTALDFPATLYTFSSGVPMWKVKEAIIHFDRSEIVLVKGDVSPAVAGLVIGLLIKAQSGAPKIIAIFEGDGYVVCYSQEDGRGPIGFTFSADAVRVCRWNPE